MGMIEISFKGSFGQYRKKTFSAMSGGHASAISELIKYLAEDELPKAIKNDHECHKDGIEPSDGYGKLGLILKN